MVNFCANADRQRTKRTMSFFMAQAGYACGKNLTMGYNSAQARHDCYYEVDFRFLKGYKCRREIFGGPCAQSSLPVSSFTSFHSQPGPRVPQCAYSFQPKGLQHAFRRTRER